MALYVAQLRQKDVQLRVVRLPEAPVREDAERLADGEEGIGLAVGLVRMRR